MNDEHVPTPQRYADVLAGNVAAARIRLKLHQRELAARMRKQGWRWYPQTVSEAEAGSRAIRAEELLGLAVALDTTIRALTSAPPEVAAVALPSGEQIPAQRLNIIDDSVRWDGDELRVSLADAARAEAAYLDELVRERREPEMAEVRQQLAAIRELLTQSRDDGKED